MIHTLFSKYRMTAYKHLHYAFLFEAVIGVFSLLAVVIVGKWGVFLLALLSIRPLVLEKTEPAHEAIEWQLFFQTFSIAVILTIFFLIATLAVIDIPWYEPEGARYLPLLALPWFVLAHGLCGYFLSKKEK